MRSKVAALLVSLTALWIFAAYVTVREGTNLLALNTLVNRVGVPSEALTAALQAERRASLLYLGQPSAENEWELAGRRALTDAAVAKFRAGAADSTVRLVGSDDLKARMAEVNEQLSKLVAVRSAVNMTSIVRSAAFDQYTETIDSVFRAYGSLVAIDDDNIAALGRALVKVSRGMEMLQQEDSLLTGAMAAGDFDVDDHARFVEYVGAQRFLFSDALRELPFGLDAPLQTLLASPEFASLRDAEDSLARHPTRGLPSSFNTTDWAAITAPVLEKVRTFVLDANQEGLRRAVPVAAGVIVRLALLGGLGLIAVIASIVVSITTARNLVRQLERLRNSARDLASYRLPRVVERLQQGEQVDVKQEAPPLDFGRDEIGQVGEAFNQVQETAIRVAVEQAELRRSVRDVFLSLARRSQALLHRQLSLLDTMERRATDSEELAELFRIDHLATRMRRNAENLIVLSGATAGRAWRKPVPMVDVLRGALAEVEDYTRVTVLPVGNASLLGRAVGDVIHLLAELIENAVSFSPPQTTVRVGGSVVGYGFAVEIEDRGLGMSADELAAANEQLRDPPEFRLTSTARLGLYVVAKLAERHGIRVRLTDSPYGGTTAVVLLPGSIMAEGEEDPLDPSQLDSYRPAQLAGVGRHRLQTDADRPAAAGRGETATAIADAPAGLNGSSHAPLAIGSSNGQPSLAPAPLPPAYPPPSASAATYPPVAASTTVSSPETPAPSPSPAAESRATKSTEPPKLTAAGLPWRQRATSEPPTLAGPAVSPAAARPRSAPPAPRNPEATRSMMASYRSGTLRGRSDAARLAEAAGTAADATTARTGTPAEPATQPARPEEYPQWTQSTLESPQWTETQPRTTEEGG